ncbi:MAG TPA: transketolase C-terminal domain-containing protein [Gemmatimonadales bacterium]|nr:transketolase C-terminal domain-containing protein [Gemmatimonadales bacterium]
MPELRFVPQQEFGRLDQLQLGAAARTRLFATFCRINALYMIARAGSGHIGSSFSSLDIVSWLYLNELEPADLYFSSKGHDVPGLYAVLLGLGILPFDNIHQLRRMGGLPGHPDVATPGIVTNTGPLGMGVSKAKGMAIANRLQGKPGRIYILTGDGELQEGQLWESLSSAANSGLGEITAIVDHNKVQSDTFVKNVSDLGDLKAKFRTFGWEVARCDGHDFAALERVLKRFRKISDRPKVLIADTIKGAGVSFMQHTAMMPEERFYRFHSGAPDDDAYARAVAELIASADSQLAAASAPPLRTDSSPRPERAAAAGAQRMVVAYSRELLRQAEREPRLVALDADLELDCGLIPFRERFPDRYVECGIAEQDMVSQAGGMALRGLLPVVHSFACFLSTRANEQIYNNATERRKTVYVGSLAGLLPSGPGHSHQSVRDIAALASIPGLVALEPSCQEEVALAVDYCVKGTPESCYLRLVSVPCDIPYQLPPGYRLQEGRGAILTEGDDAVLFGYGPVLLPQAYVAAAALKTEHGIGLSVVNLPWLNRVDDAWLRRTLGDRRHIFTLDNHYVHGGQGQLIASRIAGFALEPAPRVYNLGVTDIPVCGTNAEALAAHELDSAGLVRHVVAAIERQRQRA